MPKPAPDSHDFATLEPDIIDADMSRADIVFALEHLSFRANGLSTLQLDRQVRDYLVDALRRSHAARAVR